MTWQQTRDLTEVMLWVAWLVPDGQVIKGEYLGQTLGPRANANLKYTFSKTRLQREKQTWNKRVCYNVSLNRENRSHPQDEDIIKCMRQTHCSLPLQ